MISLQNPNITNNSRNIIACHSGKKEFGEAVIDTGTNTLYGVKGESRKTLDMLEYIIYQQGTDYRRYDEQAKRCVMQNVKIMQLIKVMLDIAILDKNGNVLGDANSNIHNVKKIIDNNYQGKIA